MNGEVLVPSKIINVLPSSIDASNSEITVPLTPVQIGNSFTSSNVLKDRYGNTIVEANNIFGELSGLFGTIRSKSVATGVPGTYSTELKV